MNENTIGQQNGPKITKIVENLLKIIEIVVKISLKWSKNLKLMTKP